MGRLFGTDGVRGIVGKTMTPELAMNLGRAIGTQLGSGSTVALGRDARTSGPMLASAAASGLLSAGVNVVRLGISPTPAIQFYVASHRNVDAGMIVTASHNPAEWNGLKFIAGDGTEAGRADEEEVEDILARQAFADFSWSTVGKLEEDPTANESYLKAVMRNVNATQVRRRRFRVVVDAAGGPGALTTPTLLERLGAKVIPLHGEIDGSFAGREPEPVEENLAKLKRKVRAAKADLGIAHDGDADRCIFVDDRGAYVPGDQSFALLAMHALKGRPKAIVCTPVSTGSVVEEVVRRSGGRVEYTAIGSPIVARRMRETRAVFGGEENGGLIFPQHQYCRDGLLVAGKMLEFLAARRVSLSQARSELPEFFVSKRKLPCPDEKKGALIGAIRTWAKKEHAGAKVDETDGIKIVLKDGWVLARPSGTEPVFRVFGEGRSPTSAEALAQSFVDAAQRLLADL